MENTGLGKPRLETYRTSRIENFEVYGLDVDESGEEYKPGSIYVEAIKPIYPK